MSNNDSKIISPVSSLEKLVKCFDAALVNLDEAEPHFELAVLPSEEYLDPNSNIPVEERDRVMALVENYTLMSSFLLGHPLLEVMRQIRDESILDDDSPALMSLRHNIKEKQIWKHYKGGVYNILMVTKDSNQPLIEYIHYRNVNKPDSQIWTLPVYEFIKSIEFEGNRVNRFSYLMN